MQRIAFELFMVAVYLVETSSVVCPQNAEGFFVEQTHFYSSDNLLDLRLIFQVYYSPNCVVSLLSVILGVSARYSRQWKRGILLCYTGWNAITGSSCQPGWYPLCLNVLR